MHTLKILFAEPRLSRRFSVLAFAALLVLCSLGGSFTEAEAQNVRYSAPFPSVSSTTSTPFLVANVPPNSPILAVCNSPANQVPCTNYATTYTSSGVACSNGAQDTPDPQPSNCQATGDAQGNIGFWARPGQYDYTVCIQNSVTCLGPYTVTLGGVAGGVTTASPQFGDTIRWNLNGDSAWDPANIGPYPWVAIFPTSGTALLSTGLANGQAVTTFGNGSNVWPTATSGWLYGEASSAATASTNTNVGWRCCESGSTSLWGILDFYRVSVKIAFGNTAGCRYWLGLGNYNSGGVGNNPLAILNSTAYASDAPNKTTIGFFESPGTFPNWQAVSIMAGVGQTTVNTGVAPDGNAHLFEVTSNSTGTALTYWIDAKAVATISTNLPTPASQYDALGEMFFTGDNKNASNSCSSSLSWFLWSMR